MPDKCSCPETTQTSSESEFTVHYIHFLFSKNSSVPMQCHQDSNKNTFPWLSVTLCLKCISKSNCQFNVNDKGFVFCFTDIVP